MQSEETNKDFMQENYEVLRSLKALEVISSEVFICGLDIDKNNFFESLSNKDIKRPLTQNQEIDIKKLIFLSDIILEILKKTESYCRVNIIFTNLHKSAPLAFYENILSYFYSIISIKSKFLESKKFIITFPQIFSPDFKANDNSTYALDAFDYENNFKRILSKNIFKFTFL